MDADSVFNHLGSTGVVDVGTREVVNDTFAVATEREFVCKNTEAILSD